MTYHVITDVDGVLLKYLQGFALWNNYKFADERLQLTSDGMRVEGEYEIPVNSRIIRFTQTPVYANLTPTIGSENAIRKIYSDGALITVVSSCLPIGLRDYEIELAEENRIKNLTDKFGKVFSNIRQLPIGKKKVITYVNDINWSPYPSDKIFLIEDHLDQINETAENSPDAANYFLFDWGNGYHPEGYKVHKSVTIVRSWADLYRRIEYLGK